MSGIAGGIPRQVTGEGDHDEGSNSIRLGDVVVAMQSDNYSGIVPYNQGKERDEGFELTGWMDKIPGPLRQGTTLLQRRQRRKAFRLQTLLEQEATPQEYVHPNLPDNFFNPSYQHKSESQRCEICSETELVKRALREEPRCHFGLVLSGEAQGSEKR